LNWFQRRVLVNGGSDGGVSLWMQGFFHFPWIQNNSYLSVPESISCRNWNMRFQKTKQKKDYKYNWIKVGISKKKETERKKKSKHRNTYNTSSSLSLAAWNPPPDLCVHQISACSISSFSACSIFVEFLAPPYRKSEI
jgi:hypothetical protein